MEHNKVEYVGHEISPLIKHLLRNNLDGIVANSLKNCHLEGLHSIMLLNSPEQTIRMFVTEEGCPLHFNHPETLGRNGMNQTLAFHPHHCNLTLYCIQGRILNWTIRPAETPEEKQNAFYLDKWIYSSVVSGSKMEFRKLDSGQYMVDDALTQLIPGHYCMLDAKDIHTVASNVPSAWLVFEGKEDPEYVPYCYSNADLTKTKTANLYQPMDEKFLLELIAGTGLITPKEWT